MEEAEWIILPKAIDLIANGKVKVGLYGQSNYRRRTDMKVLIVGSGGREHAIAYKCSKKQSV